MTMIHMDYPLKRGFFTWEEMGCLAKALGFPVDTFYNSIPEEYTGREDGVTEEVFEQMMDYYKYFNLSLDRTFNIHTDEWNLCVIKRAIPLLHNHITSFTELQSVRLAFQMYESQDTKGMVLDEKVLLRALKMCTRMISPMKMMHRIKHMRPHLEEKDRIQLHEFFDLMLWCQTYRHIDKEPITVHTSRNERHLYELEDFGYLLSHEEQRLHESLDQQYMQQEWQFTKEKHSTSALPKDMPPVNSNTRKQLVAYHNKNYEQLQAEVMDAQQRVHQARAGYVRPRPVSAPDLHIHRQHKSLLLGVVREQRPQTVMQIAREMIHSRTPRSDNGGNFRWQMVPVPRSRTPSAVMDEDMHCTQKNIEALQFDMEVLDGKYESFLNEDMDFLLPGYREKKMKHRPKRVPQEKAALSPPEEMRPSSETVERWLEPKPRAPRAAHSKSCDARFRGFHGTQSRRGSHVILVTPAYDNSARGQLYQKVHRKSLEEGKLKPFLERYNSSNNLSNRQRPTTESGKVKTPKSGRSAEKAITADKETHSSSSSGRTKSRKSEKDVARSILSDKRKSADNVKLSETTSELNTSETHSLVELSTQDKNFSGKKVTHASESSKGSIASFGIVSNKSKSKDGLLPDSKEEKDASTTSVVQPLSDNQNVIEHSKISESEDHGITTVIEKNENEMSDVEMPQDMAESDAYRSIGDKSSKNTTTESQNNTKSSKRKARVRSPSYSELSFVSGDICVSPELADMTKQGPCWIRDILSRTNHLPHPKSARTKRACHRLVDRLQHHLSADMRMRLQNSVLEP